ncbi:malate:quinone oxidoreductase [Nesterenkonia halobia]|uniref:Probable malate:quinone oxidoreductase n=2 Tax=Nesterenkonia halobia TaxID=37922 RepID=A0ABP6RCV1_9MICC
MDVDDSNIRSMSPSSSTPTEQFDVILVGAGIMSMTLGAVLSELEPHWSIGVFESLDRAGRESSDAWNNAGTGHAALCELNYTPQDASGRISPAKAIGINEQFQVSRQLWSHWVEEGVLGAPRTFITGLPHMSFVRGDAHVDYLRRRYENLARQPVFSAMRHTEDPCTIDRWAPLLMRGRASDETVAATRVEDGTDVDFGAMTRQLAAHLDGARASFRHRRRVTAMEQDSSGCWSLRAVNTATGEQTPMSAKYVFVGAGGGTLKLLQSAGLPQVRGYAGFPVGGQFLRTTDPETVQEHHAKVYGLPRPGAPPMSVPHLDTRVVDGERAVLFGPYASFSPRFLAQGRRTDLIASLRRDNILPLLHVAQDRRDLVRFLVKEVAASRRSRADQLFDYVPAADPERWELLTAGQRVQVIKPGPAVDGKPGRGQVKLFGTELVVSRDRTVAGLLGASPGASTAPEIVLRTLSEVFPEKRAAWEPRLVEMIPSYGRALNEDPRLLEELAEATSRRLDLG